MTSTIAILWETFGLTGLASAVAWTAAAALVAAGIPQRQRWPRWIAAVGLAGGGVLLAALTLSVIRSIEVDRSAEALAAEAAGAKATLEKFRGRAAGIRFAEDTAVDQADLAGVTAAEEEGAYERSVAGQLAKLPAYARGGRKERAGRSPAKPQTGTESAAPADSSEDALPPGRRLPQSQLDVADRYERLNRGVAWSVLCVAVGLVAWEYVRRFNSPFDAVWPLPLAGTAVDGMMPKQHVLTLTEDTRTALPRWLETMTRKGESFLVFADDASLPQITSLPRFTAGPLRWLVPVHWFSADSLRADPSLVEVAFESAWFNRGCGIVTGESGAGDVLAQIATLLARRRQCHATARRTLVIVWSLPVAPPTHAADEITRLAASTNICWAR